MQCGPGCDDIGREIVHLHVAAIANDQALMAVEHAKTLRHIVDRTPHVFRAAGCGKGETPQRRRSKWQPTAERNSVTVDSDADDSHSRTGRRKWDTAKVSAKPTNPASTTNRQPRAGACAD